MTEAWQKTACILCSLNCGIEVQLDGRRLARFRGNRAHSVSQGYLCEKALRLDYYQNGRDRLTSPLRRRADGSFEEIDWDTAIREVAERLGRVRDLHGGETILYYGGAGQGNHLCGVYARATRAALGSSHMSHALAQEKTGEFWVDAQLYGQATCHTSGDFEHAEVGVIVGKNPWQSHGISRARVTLRALSADPARALVVIDPRRTETAEIATYHLQVRPGTDAFCLSALLAVLVQEDLVDHVFLDKHTTGFEHLREALGAIQVADFAAHAGVPEALVREVARRIARASSVSTIEDLGVQQAPHSTLNTYLEKLLYLLTGNFAKRGAMNIHSWLGNLDEGREGEVTPVGGHRLISGFMPANVIPDEILSDHPKRFRAMLVESANPAHSVADSQRVREALAALDTVVVIDVAMTETARLAHYVLPAASQYEKWEATFFTLEFPRNVFHLRPPILDPLPGTLPEAEIHRRLVRALGALSDDDLAGINAAAARIAVEGRFAYAAAFFQAIAERPHLAALAPVVFYETLGPTLTREPGQGARNTDAAAAAVLWGAAHMCAMNYTDSVRRAGFKGEVIEIGEQLFEAVLAGDSGVTFTVDDYEETWRRLRTPDGRVRVAIPELLPELRGLASEDPGVRDPRFPFVLAAGERRSSTANAIVRDPGWRKKDIEGALRLSPADAAKLGIEHGGRARITTKRASVVAVVEITDTLQPGHATLPNGLGLAYPDGEGRDAVRGVPPNELTASEDRDWIAGTPWYKHVPARIEAI